MCNPAAIQAAVAVVGAAYGAQQQAAQGRYQRGVNEYNAAVAANEAQKEKEAGVEAENMQRRRTAELIAKQRTQLAAANIDLGSGSALQLQEDTAALGEADALRIRSNTADRAKSLLTQSTLLGNQGAFAQSAGRAAAVGTLLSGAGAVLSTGVADKWFTPASAANAGGQ